jgi:hypothetical protein
MKREKLRKAILAMLLLEAILLLSSLALKISHSSFALTEIIWFSAAIGLVIFTILLLSWLALTMFPGKQRN